MKCTTCNKCGYVFEDNNPSDESKEYPEWLPVDELVPLHEDEDGESDIFYGCPNCLTDGNLVDNINANAGPVAAAIALLL